MEKYRKTIFWIVLITAVAGLLVTVFLYVGTQQELEESQKMLEESRKELEQAKKEFKENEEELVLASFKLSNEVSKAKKSCEVSNAKKLLKGRKEIRELRARTTERKISESEFEHWDVVDRTIAYNRCLDASYGNPSKKT